MRFYCFYSWLANFPKLTTEELRCQGYDGATKQNNWEHVNNLYQTLKVAESKFTLENLLPKITEGFTEEMVAEKRL